MATQEHGKLWELVDVADVAVRVASQLRRTKGNFPLTDLPAIERAKDFMNRARLGGNFMARKETAGFEGSLTALTWAADAYWPTPQASPTKMSVEEYENLTQHLDQIIALISAIPSKRPSDTQLEKGIIFFQTLGDLLGSRAERDMPQESITMTR